MDLWSTNAFRSAHRGTWAWAHAESFRSGLLAGWTRWWWKESQRSPPNRAFFLLLRFDCRLNCRWNQKKESENQNQKKETGFWFCFWFWFIVSGYRLFESFLPWQKNALPPKRSGPWLSRNELFGRLFHLGTAPDRVCGTSLPETARTPRQCVYCIFQTP